MVVPSAAASEASGTNEPKAPISSLILFPPELDRTCVVGGTGVFLVAGTGPSAALGAETAAGRNPSLVVLPNPITNTRDGVY